LASSFSGGFDWTSLLSGFRAEGGPVDANALYRVNERGPELLSVGNKDFLMMGSRAGRITSNEKLGSGSQVSQFNNFMIQGRMDRRTETQIASEVGIRSQRALNRNT
jgi:hypothetical protein